MLDFSSRPALTLASGHHGRAGEPAVVIKEISGLTLVSILAFKGQKESLHSQYRTSLGLDLPQTPCRAEKDGLCLYWTGPDQWLAASEDAALPGQLATPHAALVDQSGGRAIIEISGPKVREVLRKGVTIDLDPGVFKTGEVAMTSISHVAALICRMAEDRFLMIVPRSLAGSFWHWLSVSAAEYGYEVI